MSILLFISKMVFVSCVLYCYYWFFLRNKKFHQYNRFFLLSIPVLAICIPLFNIPIPGFYSPHAGTGIRLLRAVAISGWEDAVVVTAHGSWLHSIFSWQNIVFAIYAIIVFFLLYVLVRSILYIIRLAEKYDHEKINEIKFYETPEPGTPFSFFTNIFWNDKINRNSEAGSYIFRHELYHVKQRHTADIISIELLCALFWFNPIFHLIKKELKAVHEFLADQYAVSNANTYDYAELLVWESAAGNQFNLANPFFNNQIKRRIAMITQFKNTHYSYIRRVMALPLLFILLCAFGIKTNHQKDFLLNSHGQTKYDSIISPVDFSKIDPEDIRNISLSKTDITIRLKTGDILIANRDEVEKYFHENKINFSGYDINADAKMVNGDTIVEITSLKKISVPEKMGFSKNDTTYPKVFTKVEVEAEYPGGQKEWSDFLNTNFKYPKEAINKKVQGTVVAQFIVNMDGTVSDIQIFKSDNKMLNEEVIRIIKKSGNWIPAMQNGLKVKSYKRQPVIFKLERQ